MTAQGRQGKYSGADEWPVLRVQPTLSVTSSRCFYTSIERGDRHRRIRGRLLELFGELLDLRVRDPECS